MIVWEYYQIIAKDTHGQQYHGNGYENWTNPVYCSIDNLDHLEVEVSGVKW